MNESVNIGSTAAISEMREKKRVNKTWEALGKRKGAFTVIDPKFML